MALVNTNFSLNIVAFRVCHLLHRSQNDLKLERIGTNQSSVDLNHDSVSLVEFSPSPCIELKWISMKLSPSQVKKNFFFKKKKNKIKLSKLIKNSK